MNKKFLSLLILFFLTMTFIPLLPPTSAGPYDAWDKFKAVSITNPNNDYQLFLNITYDSDMEADFDDLRFLDIDNTTELDFWLERKLDSQYAWVWVEMPADITVDNCFLMLYDNAGASSASDGDDTFWWFDDFSANDTAWTMETQGKYRQNYVNVTPSNYDMDGSYFLMYRFNISGDWATNTDTCNVGVAVGDDAFTGGIEIPNNGMYAQISSDSDVAGGQADADTFGSYTTGRISTAYMDGGWNQSDFTDSDTEWFYKYAVNTTNAINFTVYSNWRDTAELSRNTTNGAHPDFNCGFLNFWSRPNNKIASYLEWKGVGDGKIKIVCHDTDPQTTDTFIDYAFIGEYATVEPSGVIGAETTYDPPVSDYSCTTTDDLEGDWEFSESITNGTLDEYWHEDNYADWIITDRSSEWSENRSYSHWDATGTAGMNVSIINASGMNRSQVIVNIHHNGSIPTWYTNSSAGFYYQDCDGNALYLLKGQSTAAYVLYYNESTGTYWDLGTHGLINITNPASENLTSWAGGGVYNNSGEASSYYWGTEPHGANGSWLKALVNAECENISFKGWGDPTLQGLMQEPAGWQVHHQDSDWTLFNCTYLCHGLAVWNPEGEKVRWDFDIYNVFQENFTLNASRVTNFYPDGTPYWEFPIVNSSVYYVNLYEFFNETTSGNISAEGIIPLLRNITNASEKNSRPYTPDDGVVDNEPWEQYDYNRIYTATLTNATRFGWAFDNYLWVYLHGCTYGQGPDGTGHGQCFVAIDVDGDDSWDDNDRAYYTDTDNNDWEWHGSNATAWSITGNAWFTGRNAYHNIHRYNHHLHGSFFIPLAHLVKSDGKPINSSDVFNITAFVHQTFDSNICFLNNYNESACTPLMTDSHDTAKIFFINETTLEETGSLDINGTNIAQWAQGQITGAEALDEEYTYNITVNKADNVTRIGPGNLSTNINISFTVYNNGTGPLTNVFINTSFLNCSCPDSNWDWNITDASNRSAIEWHNDSCYILIHDDALDLIETGANEVFWFTVGVQQCDGENLSGIMWNNVTVNATGGYSGSDSNSIRLGGEVTRIRICYEPDVGMLSTDNTIFNIIGILLIIASVFLIMGVMKKYGLGPF